MKKTFLNFVMGVFAIALLSVTACNPDEDEDNEEEVITKVTLTLKDAAGKETSFAWNDPDGTNGTQKATVENIVLAPNATYTAAIKLENGTVKPVENITTEVQKEADVHLFIYTYDSANVTFEITDKDSKSKPLGIATKVTTKAAGDGKLRIVLKHEPTDKSNAANPGGATDVDVEFPVNVK
jgi:hypothetical protein